MFAGCTQPCYVEAGVTLDFCGRTHANKHYDRPAGTKCKYPDCPRPCWVEDEIALDYCGRRHAAAHLGRKVKPRKGDSPYGIKHGVLYFYEPRGDYGDLSQFSESEFEDEGVLYMSAEQYMMAQKAICMGDEHIREKIMAAGCQPDLIKKLGRQVMPWDEELWESIRETVVTRGNLLKFSQNTQARIVLRSTRGLALAEAAPHDRVWGIGLNVTDALAGYVGTGANKLAKILMDLRDQESEWEALLRQRPLYHRHKRTSPK